MSDDRNILQPLNDTVPLLFLILSSIGQLPTELIWKILYTHNGLTHPNANAVLELRNSFIIRDLCNGHAHRRRTVRLPLLAPVPNIGPAPRSPPPPAVLMHHEYETHCVCAHNMFALGRPYVRPISSLGQTTVIRHCHRPPPYSRLSFLPYPRSCSLARLLRVMINNIGRTTQTINNPHNHRDAWRPLASLSASVFGGPTGCIRRLPLTHRDTRDTGRKLICQRLGFRPGDPEHSYLWSLRIPRAVVIRTYYKLPDDAPYSGTPSVFTHRPAKIHALTVLLQTLDRANTCWAPPLPAPTSSTPPTPPTSSPPSSPESS